jgi:hypothetical protein
MLLSVTLQVLTDLAADEDQKLLLWVDYVSATKGMLIPWDEIALQMEPRNPEAGELPMTGEAIKQHLAKLRNHRVKEGYAVPPKLDRSARRSIAGKQVLQTPVHSQMQRKDGPSPILPGRRKAQVTQSVTSTPVKKESSLLAPVSKSKQKKVDRAIKAAAKEAKRSSGGVRSTNGKRGRRPAATEDDDSDEFASIGVTTRRQLRFARRKDDDENNNANIKNELDSDDHVPLLKRRKTTQKPVVQKASVRLLDDAVETWDNRGAKISASESPIPERVVEPVINEARTSRHQEEDHSNQSQLAPVETPNNAGIPFCHDAGYQANDTRGSANNRFNGGVLRSNWPPTGAGYLTSADAGFISTSQAPALRSKWPQTGAGYVSSADDGFMSTLQASAQPGLDQSLLVQGIGSFPGVQLGQTSGVQIAPTYGQLGQQTFDQKFQLNSSPLHDSLSSATFPGSDLGMSFGTDNSGFVSNNITQNSSFSSARGLHDPFVGNMRSRNYHSLPLMGSNTTTSRGQWPAPPYLPSTGTDLNTCQQFPDYTHSQTQSGFPASDPTMSGLGMSISQSCGGIVNPSNLTNANYAFLKTEVQDQTIQAVADSTGRMAYMIPASPQDESPNWTDFLVDVENHVSFPQVPNNDFDG